MKTVRSKLLLTFGLALALALVGFGVVVHGLFRSRLDADLDAQLKTLSFAASRVTDSGRPMVQTYMEQGFDLKPGGFFVQIFDADGASLSQSVGFSEKLTLSDATRQAAPGRTEAILEDVRSPSGKALRVATFARIDYVNGQRGLRFFAMAGAPLDRHSAQLRQVVMGLLTIGGAVWLVTMLIAWLLVKHWLQTLTNLKDAARQMSAGQLTRQRVHVPPHDAEIASLSQSINHLLDHLESAHSTQQRFIADASHELRTPLTILRGEIEVALRKPRSADEYREVLQSNKEEIESLSRLTDNLLILARSDAGQLAQHRDEVDVLDVVRDVATKLQAVAEKRNVTLDIASDTETKLLGDRTQLERVMFNLIDNAISYSPADEAVSITIKRDDAHVRIEVSDAGPGITSEHLPHLFDRFYRADQSRSREHEGAGLGLAIVKTFVEAHGGTVSASSVIGHGATFVVTLPVASE